MHRRAWWNTTQHLGQRRHFEEGRRTHQAQFHFPFLRQVDQADFQPRSFQRQLHQRQAEANQYASQQVRENDGERGCRIGEHRRPTIPAQTTEDLEIHQFETGVHQHARQARHRNALQHAGQQQHERQQPQAVENGRKPRGCSSLNVRRAAHDNAGHRQSP
ncbi:hypothetical protein D3C81_890190 [compost metagenome]